PTQSPALPHRRVSPHDRHGHRPQLLFVGATLVSPAFADVEATPASRSRRSRESSRILQTGPNPRRRRRPYIESPRAPRPPQRNSRTSPLSPSPGIPGEGRGEGLLSHWHEVEPPHLDSLSAMISRSSRPLHLLGEGIPYHQQFIPSNDPGLILTPPQSWRPRA